MLAQVIAEKEELPSTRSKSVLTAAVDLADLFIGQIVCSYIRLCLFIIAVYWLSIAVYLLLSPPPTCVLRCIHSVCVVLSNCHNIALCHFVIILHCVNLIIYNDPNIQIDTNIFLFSFYIFFIVTNQQFLACLYALLFVYLELTAHTA